MKKLKVFYRPEMAVDSRGFSPSALKPKQAVADWKKNKLKIQIESFEPATPEQLYTVHDRRMVDAILSGRRNNGHGNTVLEVAESCLYTVGSLVAASKAALTDRIVCSPTSGFHHAGHDYSSGFCTFNGLMVAAVEMLESSLCSRVSILDCDMHYGDGTQDIIDRMNADGVGHWTFGEHFGHVKFNQQSLLRKIGRFLDREAENRSGLIIYQAGADPHINDPLGGEMTTEEMRERDQFVFRKAVELNMPIVYNHAGGYQKDSKGRIDAVLELHRNTAKEALLAMQDIAALSEKA